MNYSIRLWIYDLRCIVTQTSSVFWIISAVCLISDSPDSTLLAFLGSETKNSSSAVAHSIDLNVGKILIYTCSCLWQYVVLLYQSEKMHISENGRTVKMPFLFLCILFSDSVHSGFAALLVQNIVWIHYMSRVSVLVSLFHLSVWALCVSFVFHTHTHTHPKCHGFICEKEEGLICVYFTVTGIHRLCTVLTVKWLQTDQ